MKTSGVVGAKIYTFSEACYMLSCCIVYSSHAKFFHTQKFQKLEKVSIRFENII